MKWIVLVFLCIGMWDFVDTAFKLIGYIFKYFKERRKAMAKKKEPDLFQQVENRLLQNAKAAQCKGNRYTETQETLSGYRIGVYLEAPEGKKLLEVLE